VLSVEFEFEILKNRSIFKYLKTDMLHTPRHILSSRAHSDKIPTATPMFSGSYFLMVVLPVLWNVDVRQKSKMAANQPEVVISSKLQNNFDMLFLVL